ncbi:MAG: hypothetical protein ACI8WB_002684 [Phenylobacterium sp.]|jgi:hypothetical protein
MKQRITMIMFLALTQFTVAMPAFADHAAATNYRVGLYFGLSLPTGGGVSLLQWNQFERNVLAKTFEGFNVVDSTGYYQGKPERSKIVTLIINQSDMTKVNKVARQYATKFEQDSVMMVKIRVDEWTFIGKAGEK